MGKMLLELASLTERREWCTGFLWLNKFSFLYHDKMQFAVLRQIDENCDHLDVITAFL